MTPAGQEAPAEIILPRLDDARTPRMALWASALVSLALLVLIGVQFNSLSLGQMREMIPASLGFWILFAGNYLAGPISEWFIYKRLWNIPSSGMAALMRKLVSNELLLGYLGEVQFYAWARSRSQMTAAPFGAIKDVTVLSALMGNIVTLAMLVVAWPLVSAGILGLEFRASFLSLAVVLGTSFAIFFFRGRLFTLPAADLRFISLVHLARIGVMLGLTAGMWHMALPAINIGLWLVLATLRMLVSRLPLVPNKDLVFAGMAVVLLGHDVLVASLLAMMAAAMLIAHLVVGAVFGLGELVSAWRTPR